MLENTNQCSDYQKYQARELKKICSLVPEERRESLREEITARANLLGCSNTQALRTTLVSLM